jgi:hypothetical protein
MRPLRAMTGRKKVIQTENVKIVGPGTYSEYAAELDRLDEGLAAKGGENDKLGAVG